MKPTPDPQVCETYVQASAELLGLSLPAEARAGVVRYFILAAQMAEQVHGLPLVEADESGSVFRPVAPRGEA